ncbi:zinc finger protein 653 isoform X3 [Pleurodeles waltl]|uniref:zinc finger protein 653 isoform X3 n=1 Tax=Pleurodeles waltl TaxID=8319 RepID=UPI00370991E4
MAEAGSEGSGGEEEGGGTPKARGRPRLTDSDRARRRLESRKKYDVRRVYLGEAHGAWVQRRGRSGWSDARLAAYLLSLDRGEPWQQIPKKTKREKRRRRNVNCVKNLVIWYEDHQNRCPYEPLLSELDPLFGLYTTAVWQCQAGHRYFQDLRSPLKPLSDSESESEKVGDGEEVGNSDSYDEDNCWETEEQKQQLQADDQTTSQHPSQQETSLQDSGPLAFEQHHIETLSAEQGLGDCHEHRSSREAEDLGTVVCMPVPMRDGPEHRALFDSVTQDTLGEVVSRCPVQDMVPGSQVIIIAGHGYETLTSDGLQLNVSSGGEDIPCGMMESVTAYTQTEPESMDTAEQLQPTDSMEYMHTKIDTDDEVEQVGKPELEQKADLEPALDPGQENSEQDLVHATFKTTDTSAILYEAPKEPEKRRSKRGRPVDADGMLEMFHCPYEGCSQVYIALSSFQNHVNLVHRKGRTKVCPHPGCGKKFYLSNHLGRHMIIHSAGVREFICETCGKSFKRKNHLDVHRRTHTGETPLQCEICGYQCRQRASLNWHMKKHTSEVHYNFTCEYCGKPFEKLDSVKFHKLKSHPDVKAT